MNMFWVTTTKMDDLTRMVLEVAQNHSISGQILTVGLPGPLDGTGGDHRPRAFAPGKDGRLCELWEKNQQRTTQSTLSLPSRERVGERVSLSPGLRPPSPEKGEGNKSSPSVSRTSGKRFYRSVLQDWPVSGISNNSPVSIRTRMGCTFSASKPLFTGKGAGRKFSGSDQPSFLRKRFGFRGESRNVVRGMAPTGAYAAAAMGASLD